MTSPHHDSHLPPPPADLREIVPPPHERTAREINLTDKLHVEGLLLQIKEVCQQIHSRVVTAPTADLARAQVGAYVDSPATNSVTDNIAVQAFHAVNMLHMIASLPPEQELKSLLNYVAENDLSPREPTHPVLHLPRESLERLAIVVHNTWVGTAPSLEGLNMQHYLYPSDSPRGDPERDTEFSHFDWSDRFEEWWNTVQSLTALDVRPEESHLAHAVRSILPVFMALEIKHLELLHRVRASLGRALDDYEQGRS